MGNKSVAVLDIGSSAMTVLIKFNNRIATSHSFLAMTLNLSRIKTFKFLLFNSVDGDFKRPVRFAVSHVIAR